jgi:nitrate reductase gamma subunit
VGAAWLNNLDFAAAIGFPIYILFVVQAVRLLLRLFRRMTDSSDTIPLTFLLSFIVLNLAGTAQGEVPRLWLFWLPMVVIFAAYEIELLAQKNRLFLLGLAVAQCITILLTYHFQDLRM